MKRLLLLPALLLAIHSIPLVSAQEAETSTAPFIVDTDMGLDDWLAILYLTRHPNVDLLAVSLAGTGEAHCDPGVHNTLGLLELANHPEVPVACGREAPLEGNNSFPAWLRDQADAMAGLDLPANTNPPFEGTAVELLITTIQASSQPVTLVTLGPLTNVAEALQAEPAIIDNIQMIYIMGGAVDVPGNVDFFNPENHVAEANIYVDPHAAAVVFESGAPITLVPLDATNHAPMTTAFFDRLKENRTTPQAEFAYRALEQSLDFIKSGGYYFWDPLAAAIAVQEDLAALEERTLTVREEAGSANGQTMETSDGTLVRVATSVESSRFETAFLNILNGRSAQDAAG